MTQSVGTHKNLEVKTHDFKLNLGSFSFLLFVHMCSENSNLERTSHDGPTCRASLVSYTVTFVTIAYCLKAIGFGWCYAV